MNTVHEQALRHHESDTTVHRGRNAQQRSPNADAYLNAPTGRVEDSRKKIKNKKRG